jgi:hypothetical protein
MPTHEEAPAPNVEVELRATATGAHLSASPSPASVAARVEFDELILELFSTTPLAHDKKNWLERFLSKRAAKTASRALARYQTLRLTLSLADNLEYWQAARDGLRALKAGNVHLARKVATSLSLQASKSSSLARVILGIVLYIFVGMALVSAYLDIPPMQFILAPRVFFVGIRTFLANPSVMDATFAAAMFGGLGSVVSLLLRIGSFEAVRGRSPLYLFLFGLVQPIIGLIIGGVVGAALAAHLINVSFQQTAQDAPVNVYFVAVVGFLCGFSERVAKTALATAGRAVGLEEDQHAPQRQEGVMGGASAKMTLPTEKHGLQKS